MGKRQQARKVRLVPLLEKWEYDAEGRYEKQKSRGSSRPWLDDGGLATCQRYPLEFSLNKKQRWRIPQLVKQCKDEEDPHFKECDVTCVENHFTMPVSNRLTVRQQKSVCLTTTKAGAKELETRLKNRKCPTIHRAYFRGLDVADSNRNTMPEEGDLEKQEVRRPPRTRAGRRAVSPVDEARRLPEVQYDVYNQAPQSADKRLLNYPYVYGGECSSYCHRSALRRKRLHLRDMLEHAAVTDSEDDDVTAELEDALQEVPTLPRGQVPILLNEWFNDVKKKDKKRPNSQRHETTTAGVSIKDRKVIIRGQIQRQKSRSAYAGEPEVAHPAAAMGAPVVVKLRLTELTSLEDKATVLPTIPQRYLLNLADRLPGHVAAAHLVLEVLPGADDDALLCAARLNMDCCRPEALGLHTLSGNTRHTLEEIATEAAEIIKNLPSDILKPRAVVRARRSGRVPVSQCAWSDAQVDAGGEDTLDLEDEEDFIMVPRSVTGPSLCGICYEDLTALGSGQPANWTALSACEHAFCEQCWAGYLTRTINSMAARLQCPEYDCDCEVPVPALYALVNVLYVERFTAQQRDSRINAAHNIHFCPKPHCRRVLCVTSGDAGDTLRCLCGFQFCVKCQQTAHFPLSCDQAQLYRERLHKAGYLLDPYGHGDVTHSVKVKRCPKCYMPIDKKYGCNHVVCPCGTAFCYECQTGWSSDHYNCKKKSASRETIILDDSPFESPHTQRAALFNLSIRHRRKQCNKARRTYKALAGTFIKPKTMNALVQTNSDIGSLPSEITHLRLQLHFVVEHLAAWLYYNYKRNRTYTRAMQLLDRSKCLVDGMEGLLECPESGTSNLANVQHLLKMAEEGRKLLSGLQTAIKIVGIA